MSNTRDAALSYTGRGWYVIPLCWPTSDGRCGCGRGHVGKDVGKAPLAGVGYQDVRADADQARAWWRRWPLANVGLLLEPSGLLIVDLDGHEAMEEARAYGLPSAPTVRTGGGWHLYYRRPVGVGPGRKTHGGKCEHIDALAKGYVVAPPSLHVSGRRYTWAPDREHLPLPDAPTWAVDMLRPRPAPARPTGPTVLPSIPMRLSPHILAVIRDGWRGHYPSRSEGTFAVATAMIRSGHPDAEIIDTLLACGWATEGKRDPARFAVGEVARAHAKGAAPVPKPWGWVHRAHSPWAWGDGRHGA